MVKLLANCNCALIPTTEDFMRPLPGSFDRERIGKLSKQVERRAHPRLPCKGAARIHLLPDGSDLTGMLEDVSPGGCSIKSTNEISVAKLHSQVELQLDMCDHTFCLHGILCHIREQRRLGIEFVQLSSYWTEQVRHLMADLRSES
jgi:hypothetical protein